MSTDKLNSEFDKMLRNKFEGAESPIPETKWDEIDNALQENNDPFDDILKNRFMEGMQPPDFIIPDFVPPGDSSKSKNSKKWGWFVLALLVTITPLAYSLLKKSDRHKASNTLSVKENNPKEQKSTENIKSIEEYSATIKEDKTGTHLSENYSTSSAQTVIQSARENISRNAPTEQKANLIKTAEQIVKVAEVRSSGINKSKTLSNSIDNKSQKEKNNSNNFNATNAVQKKAKNSRERAPDNSIARPLALGKANPKDERIAQKNKTNNREKRETKNSTDKVSKHSTPEEILNATSEKEAQKSGAVKNSEEQKSDILINSNTVKTDSKKQSSELGHNTSKTSNTQSKLESNELKSVPSIVSNEENKIKGRETKDGNREQLVLTDNPNTVKNKTKKDNKADQTSHQNESIKVDSEEKFKPFRLSIGAYAHRSFTNTSSTNPSYQNRYQAGQLKDWNIKAELQAEYRLNGKWSIGSGVSTSSYDISMSENNFERNMTNNVHLDTVNKMILYQSSLGQTHASNLNSFEFGRTISNNLGQHRDSLNSFGYAEAQSFKFLQIPLFINYTGGKGKFHYSVGVGPLLSLISKSNSTIDIYNTAFPSNRVTITNYHKTNNLLWGATSRLGLHYDISSRFGVYARPTFNYTFTDFSKISLLSIYHHNLRIPLGINYVF